MAFESLSERFTNITRRIRGQSRITEKDLKETLREIRLVLLEADVNFRVVKEFVNVVEEKALGEDVLKSLTPGQQIIKIIRDELTGLLGDERTDINFSPNPPTIIIMAGLQGSGKTTTAGKIANLLRKQGKKPLMVACDVYRPAAIDQLKVLGKQLDIPVYANEKSKDVARIAKQALTQAKSNLNDVVIIDTAGRLEIDEVLMDELKSLEKELNPDNILLVIDSMSGQSAADVAKKFDEDLSVTGIVLTKLDADTRGGAALSVKKLTGKPIIYAAVGERMSDLEEFHPDRMAERILGMGDVLSLIEKAEEAFDEEEAEKLADRIKKNQFDLNDYLKQIKQIKKMGPLSSVMKMMPGFNEIKDSDIDDDQMVKIEAIIQSMTEEERTNHKILNASRRKRIAQGSGTTVQDINQFIKTFDFTAKVMKDMKDERSINKVMKKLKSGGYKI